jgi:hypothetical protein
MDIGYYEDHPLLGSRVLSLLIVYTDIPICDTEN